jgi:hypothetical protein
MKHGSTLARIWQGAIELGGATEREEARRKVFAALPERTQRIRHQWLGTMSAGCTATHGLHEACDFSCTACYLTSTANSTPPLPFEEVKAQLDRIRAHTGPSGSLQLTAGEVTLLPVEELARIVKYARDIGLDPMVMTHGQTFAKDPGYLHTLMRSGLQKVGIHMDTTQRGRIGQAKDASEADVMRTRDALAALVREARKLTGQRLYAAHTFTVTHDNIEEVRDVIRWFVRNVDAFRLMSLQPTAEVGRTRAEAFERGDHLWARVCEAIGLSLNSHTFTMGHPDCNSVCLFFVIRFADEIHIMEVKRESKTIDARFVDELLGGAFRGFYLDDADLPARIGRWLGLFVRSPKYLWQWPAYGIYRLADGNLSWLPRFAKTVLTGGDWKITSAAIVVHNFMSSHELGTERAKERLESCSFKVPVDGQMVSMCELNGAGIREQQNRKLQEQLVPLTSRSRSAPAELRD